MAKIIYKPTCGNCGAIISGEVIYAEEQSRDDIITIPIRHISPSHCSKCGACFDAIIIPYHSMGIDFRVNMDEVERWST